jgi:hypothetical protein
VSRRPYITPPRLAQLRWTLSPNEWAVLHDVATMRLAQATDLEALDALRSPQTVRQFRRLLKRLADQGVLFRLERSIGGRRAGSGGFVYGLGITGQRLLSAEGEQPNARRPWTPRPSWLNHALSVGRLFVILRQAEASDALKLLRFHPEPSAWRSFVGPHGGTTVLKPDAYVELGVGSYNDSFFVEVDCGTESPATLSRKFGIYRQYWQSGSEQAAYGVFPRVLWLTPTERRKQVLVKVAQQQPADSSELHRIAPYNHFFDVITGPPP